MKQDWKGVGSYGTVGLEIVLSIIVGLVVGQWLDKKLGTEPIFTLIWLGFGVAAAIKAIVRASRDMRADAAREEREQGNPAPLFPPREKAEAEKEDDRPMEDHHGR